MKRNLAAPRRSFDQIQCTAVMNMLTSNYHDCPGTVADFVPFPSLGCCRSLPLWHPFALSLPLSLFPFPFAVAITTLITAFCPPEVLSRTGAVNRNFVVGGPPILAATRAKLLARSQSWFVNRVLDLFNKLSWRAVRLLGKSEMLYFTALRDSKELISNLAAFAVEAFYLQQSNIQNGCRLNS